MSLAIDSDEGKVLSCELKVNNYARGCEPETNEQDQKRGDMVDMSSNFLVSDAFRCGFLECVNGRFDGLHTERRDLEGVT
jgi:hypothetical protein